MKIYILNHDSQIYILQWFEYIIHITNLLLMPKEKNKKLENLMQKFPVCIEIKILNATFYYN